MKCIHCGSEWSSTTSLTKCPFCGKPLSESTQKTKTLISTLVEIRDLGGIGTLGSGKALVSSFRDLAPALKKEFTMLSYLEKCGGVTELFQARDKTAGEQDVVVNKVVRRMADELMVAEGAAQSVCRAYMLVLTGRELPQENAALTPAAKPAPRPSAPVQKPAEPPKPATPPPAAKAAASFSPDTQKILVKAMADTLAQHRVASEQKPKQDPPAAKTATPAQKPAAKAAASFSPDTQKAIDKAVADTLAKHGVASGQKPKQDPPAAKTATPAQKPAAPAAARPAKKTPFLMRLLGACMYPAWGVAIFLFLKGIEPMNTDGSFYVIIPMALALFMLGRYLFKKSRVFWGLFVSFLAAGFLIMFFEFSPDTTINNIILIAYPILCAITSFFHGPIFRRVKK